MSTVITLVECAKKDLVAAFGLYFEPLVKLWVWLKSLWRSREIERSRSEGLVTGLEATVAIHEYVPTKADLEQSPHFRSRLVTGEFLPHLGDELINLSPDSLESAEERIQALVSKLVQREGFASFTELSSFHAVQDQGSQVFIVFESRGMGKAYAGHGLAQLGEVSLSGVERLLLANQIEVHVPADDALTFSHFETYLEVASFLLQEGHNEAAAAVLARAFRLLGTRREVRRRDE